MLITHRQPNLNHLQEIDIASQRLVVVVGRPTELADRTRNNPWKLGIHCHVWILSYHRTYMAHLGLERIGPHIANAARHDRMHKTPLPDAVDWRKWLGVT